MLSPTFDSSVFTALAITERKYSLVLCLKSNEEAIISPGRFTSCFFITFFFVLTGFISICLFPGVYSTGFSTDFSIFRSISTRDSFPVTAMIPVSACEVMLRNISSPCFSDIGTIPVVLKYSSSFPTGSFIEPSAHIPH